MFARPEEKMFARPGNMPFGICAVKVGWRGSTQMVRPPPMGGDGELIFFPNGGATSVYNKELEGERHFISAPFLYTVRRGTDASTEFINAGYDTSDPIKKYWEVLEMVRKLFLTTLVLLFNKGTTMQIALACVWSLVFLLAHALYQPFKDPADNRLQTLALSSLSATYFIGVLIQVRPTAGQSAQFATLLTILTAVVACAATISTTLHAYKRGAGAVRSHQGQLSVQSDSRSSAHHYVAMEDGRQ